MVNVSTKLVYLCMDCYNEFDASEDAENCCSADVSNEVRFVCGECGTEHVIEKDATDCCVTDITGELDEESDESENDVVDTDFAEQLMEKQK